MVNGDSVRIDLSSSGYLGLSSWYNRVKASGCAYAHTQ